MAERWLPVVGFEGWYEVSDQGRVRSLDRMVRCGGAVRKSYLSRKPGRVLRPGRMLSGHLSVSLGRAAGSRTVHSLVMLAFVGAQPPNKEVRHKNGDPADNRLCNLEYGTRSQNGRDKKYHAGAKGYKLSPRQVREIKHALKHSTGVSLSRRFGVAQSTISAIKTGRFHCDVHVSSGF